MANVDSKLHNDGDLTPEDRSSEKPKRGLRGAAGGIYIGPVLSRAAFDGEGATITHATAAAAGGVDGSTGYRQSDTYYADGDATGGGMGEGGTIQTRPTGRSRFVGDGVFGGSVAGYPAQRVGQRAAAATGDTGTADAPTGAGAFIDKRSTNAGEGGRQLGSSGRGTHVKGTTVTTGGSGSGRGGPFIGRPTIGGTANPAAGTVCVGTGTAAGVLLDLHADDVTGGANGYAGMEVLFYERGTDTDEDGAAPVQKHDFDSATAADYSTGLTAGTTYAIYVRFKDPNGNVGPLSARGTVATHA